MNAKNYLSNVNFSGKALILILFLSLSSTIHSQVRVNFTPREAIASPTTSIYNIKGDFTIIGNTNLTLNNYDVNEPNSNNNMIYVDVDGDPNTFNSSSANLTFSTENGAIPECSKIVFAGLYWTGRASNGSNSPDTFNVTKNSVTKTFNKRKVQLKGPTATSYTEITAGTNDIYYPQTNDGFMYSAYAEITEYVKTNGLGEYTIADIALIEGNGGGTGYYGGWGIIVVYENSKMKWRDITVFDGHAYVQGSTTVSHQIPISGFNAVQTGQVNIKLGLMAGEGDRSISGDYFNILRSSDNNWQALNHSGNSTNNFFNSSIQTGGNIRNPSLVNNTGLDISMFDIPNPGNSVIANNQTSTTLRYGSTQDTYVIFMAAMAVDAYIPDPEGVMSLVTINGVPATSTTTVTPGQEIEYSIKILNEGTEPVNNTQIKIQLPYITSFVNGSQSGTINFSPLPSPNNLYFDANDGPSGSLIWDIGTLPVPATPNTILGELIYKVKVSEDCFLLSNPNCIPTVSLIGFINGVGAISGIQIIDKPFFQGYVSSGLCIGDPILNPITTAIDVTNFINQNCQNTITELVFNYCSPLAQVPFNSIASNYLIGTQFYNSFPITSSSIEYTSSNPFPNVIGNNTYYAILPNTSNCYYTFTINIVGNPTISSPQNLNIAGCNLSDIAPLLYSETPVQITLQDFINAGGNVSNNQLSYTISYVDISSGACPLVVTRTFTIISSCSTQTIVQTINIDDETAPTIDIDASDLTVECDGSGNLTQLNDWLAANGGASASDSCSSVTWSNDFSAVSDQCGATGSVTVTFTATDECGNLETTSATFTIQDTTDPTISISASDLTVECDGNGNLTQLNDWLAVNGGASASDSCSSVTWSNDFSAVSDQCGATGSVTVTFTATDDCGNSESTSATFTIQDTTEPTITISASDLTVECDGSGNLIQLNDWLAVNGGASASDSCSSVTWSNDFSTISDQCGATGSVTVTFTATDDCGNSETTSATFTIQDTTDPTISISASDLTVECDGSGNVAELNAWLASNGGASASDSCSSVTWSNDFSAVSDQCGATGSVTVTFTATDECGNLETTSATFTIQDTTEPTITISASDLTVECDGSGNLTQLNDWLAANGGASASDSCSSVTWSNDFSAVSDQCGATGSVTVTFTATDDCGNSETTSATFTIQDTTEPTISISASDLTVECDGSGNLTQLNDWLAANGGASASDSCSSVTWSNDFSAVSDQCGATGSVTVTFTATDECGNSETTSATFTIQDTENPYFTSVLPQDISASCDNIPSPEILEGLDNCSTTTHTFNEEIISDEESCAGNYILIRTWTLTDDCGNSVSHSQTITVYDTTPPALISNLDTEVSVRCSEIPEIPNLEFSDNCSEIAEVEFSEETTIISIYEYIIIRTWIVSDTCGNFETFVQTINVSVDEPFDAIPFSVCSIEDPIDLFTILGAQIPTNGEWVDLSNTGGLNGSMFNPINIPTGYYTLQYVVTVEDDACPMVFEIYLNINDDCIVLPACTVEVFNAVSPNNDGLNDLFLIDGIECYPDNSVEIYNRWGILIYETRGYDNNTKAFKGYSDGRSTFNRNELVPDGTYFYILRYKDEDNKWNEKSGYLYVNR